MRPRRVVIVGGGFGGLHLVRRLEGRLRSGEAAVTLLDRNNYHLFTPLLYQVATGELPSHAVAYPLRSATSRAGARFIQTEVEAIDVEARRVRTADGDVPYDHLVLAAGSVTNDYGIAGVGANGLPLKSLGDALALKRHILSSFERASAEADPDRRRRFLTFIIVGAGPLGVELASSIRDLVDHTLRPLYPHLDLGRRVSIVVIDGSERVLPQMDPRLGLLARRRLEKQRIRLVLGTLVREIGPEIVLTKEGGRFDGHTIVWAGGVRVNPLLASIELPRRQDARVVVDRGFRAGGRSDVLAFGDAAYFEQDGRALPQLAQVAVLQAPAVARNLVRLLRDQAPVPYRHHPKGDLIALGRTNAGAQMQRIFGVPAGGIVFGGVPAWTVWRVNYLTQLLGVRNRASLLTEWTLSLFFSRMVANTP